MADENELETILKEQQLSTETPNLLPVPKQQELQSSSAIIEEQKSKPDCTTTNDINAVNTSATCETVNSLKARHNKELEELEAQLKETLKHVGKKNRKRKKQLWATYEEEKQILIGKQKLEMAKNGFSVPDNNAEENKDDQVEKEGTAGLQENGNVAPNHTTNSQKKKKSKSQRRREKRLAEERAREERLRLEESTFVSAKDVETRNLLLKLSPYNLKVYDIKADGHCLFRAVEHQLSFLSSEETTTETNFNHLRERSAMHMKKFAVDYKPFYDAAAQQDAQSFEAYCDDMATSARWGGSLELKALSEILRRPIHVYRVSGPITKMGEQFSDAGKRKPLRVSFHQHYYALGEHYNSVV